MEFNSLIYHPLSLKSSRRLLVFSFFQSERARSLLITLHVTSQSQYINGDLSDWLRTVAVFLQTVLCFLQQEKKIWERAALKRGKNSGTK